LAATPAVVELEQENDSQLQHWIQRQLSTSSSSVKLRRVPFGEKLVWAIVSGKCAKILVPTSLQKLFFHAVHDVSHMGSKACARLMKNTCFWPRMTKDINQWTKSCESCQRNKISRHTKSFLEQLPEPSRRFSHIHVDLVGPLNPPCSGKNMLFTIIDRWTGWPEAIPISMRGQAASAAVCARLLIEHWIAKFGIPETITSDRGSQFVSNLWQELSKIIGFTHRTTTAYHPEANGKVERMHRSLKNALRCKLDGSKNWLAQVPWALLGLRSAPNTDTGLSPAVLVFGQHPDLPGQMVLPKKEIGDFSAFGAEFSSAMAAQQVNKTPWHGADKRPTFIPKDLQTCRSVLIRSDAIQPSLQPRYTGPYDVIERRDKNFVLQFPNKIDTVSIDRLIPFFR